MSDSDSIMNSIITGIISSVLVSIFFMNIQNKIQSYRDLYDCLHHYWYFNRYLKENPENKIYNLNKAKRDFFIEYDRLGHFLTIKLENEFQNIGESLFIHMVEFGKKGIENDKNIREYCSICKRVMEQCNEYKRKIWITSLKDIGKFIANIAISGLKCFWDKLRDVKKLRELRKMKDSSIEQKKEQYVDVANRIKEVIDAVGFIEGEGGFILAKKWLMNNEKLSFIGGVKEVIFDIIDAIYKACPFMYSTILGVIIALWTKRESFPWEKFLIILIIMFLFEIAIEWIKKGKSEKYSYRILSEMTYEEYVTLIKIDEKKQKPEPNTRGTRYD